MNWGRGLNGTSVILLRFGCLVVLLLFFIVLVFCGLFRLRHRTIPDGLTTEIDQPVSASVVTVEGDLVALIQRTQTPNDRLTLVRVNGQVQGIGSLQRSLVRDDRVSVYHRCVQEADGVGVVLGGKKM